MTGAGPPPALRATGLSVRRGNATVLPPLDLAVPGAGVTALVGPNGCGKTTLLRALAGLQSLASGRVELFGGDMARLSRRAVARQISILPQAPAAPDGLRVRDLVARGRLPHIPRFRPPGPRDRAAVARALERTGLTGLADRTVESLSGGQRQRAWIALCLAQDTPFLMLDEPTAWLDLAHQVALLSLITGNARAAGRGVLVVLHDLNLAARFADRLIVMRDGRVAADGAPAELISERLLARVFGLDAAVIADPLHGTPLVLPR